MTTISARPVPELGYVELTLADAPSGTSIIRSDVNGTRPVRLRLGQLQGGRAEVNDYEASMSGLVQYRLQGGAKGDAWTSLGGEFPRFHLPHIPQFTVAAQSVKKAQASRRSRSVFHEIVDRPAALVNEQPMETRSGTLDVWFPSYSEARDLDDLLERGQVAMYRQAEHPGMDMYFHAESTELDQDEEAGGWTLAVAYREAEFNTAPVLSWAGWTFDALAARGGTFDQVPQTYGSFHDLAVGDAL